MTVDEVDLLLLNDLRSEPLDRQGAVELARVPHIGHGDGRSALERKRRGLRVVHQRSPCRQRSDFDRTDLRISRRPRRQHVGVNAGGGQAMNLLVDKRIGGELPGPLGLWNEV